MVVMGCTLASFLWPHFLHLFGIGAYERKRQENEARGVTLELNLTRLTAELNFLTELSVDEDFFVLSE